MPRKACAGPERWTWRNKRETPAKTPMQTCWYAVRVRSNFEFRVRASLRARGVEEFLPCIAETVRWTDRRKTAIRPLFGGYIFARFDRLGRSAEVLGTCGVIQILAMVIADGE